MIIFFFFFFFFNRLRDLRKSKNLTIAQLSKEVGIPASTLSMYEQGKRNPSQKNLSILAKFFDIPESELYSNASTENNETSIEINKPSLLFELAKYGIAENDIMNLPIEQKNFLLTTIANFIKLIK